MTTENGTIIESGFNVKGQLDLFGLTGPSELHMNEYGSADLSNDDVDFSRVRWPSYLPAGQLLL